MSSWRSTQAARSGKLAKRHWGAKDAYLFPQPDPTHNPNQKLVGKGKEIKTLKDQKENMVTSLLLLLGTPYSQY